MNSENFKLRTAAFSDLPRLKYLWEQAFGEEKGFMDGFFEKRFEPDNTLILENKENGKLLSMLFVLPCKIKMFNGDIISAVNIVGVATDAEERHRGYMTRLIDHCFGVLKSRDIKIAVLKPSNREFYEQYGFKVCNILYEAEIEPGIFKNNNFNAKVYHDITPELIEKLDLIYSGCGYSGGKLLRTFDDWKFHLKGMAYTVVVIDNSAYHLCVEKCGKLISSESLPMTQLPEALSAGGYAQMLAGESVQMPTGKSVPLKIEEAVSIAPVYADNVRKRGYTMYKMISGEDLELENKTNLIFEQY